MFRKNVAGQFIHVQGVDTATGGIKSAVTWTVRRCIDGTFAAATGTATEDGTTGWYKFALSQADTNGNNIGFNFTGTGAVPQTVNIVTTACDPTTATNFGITALPAVASGSAGAVLIDGTGTAAISNSAGKVLLQATQTGVTIPTVTTVTNQLTTAQVATGVWTDTTAGDFTAALSVGKSVMNGVSLGTGLTVAAVSGAVGSVTGLTASNLDTTVSSRMATYTQPTGFLAATFPAGTVANTTNITAGTITTATNLTTNNDKTGYGLSSAAVQAIWDALTSALTTVGSIGKKLADWTIGTAQTGDSFARLGAPAGASVSADVAAVKVDTAAIKAKTDSLTFGVAGQVDANIQSVNDVAVTGIGTSGSPWGP